MILKNTAKYTKNTFSKMVKYGKSSAMIHIFTFYFSKVPIRSDSVMLFSKFLWIFKTLEKRLLQGYYVYATYLCRDYTIYS
jgi:hypothetical protein